MRWKLNGPPLALGLIAVIAAGWFVQWRVSFALLPRPDWEHLGVYQSVLERSRHPRAIAIRSQINAGPAALARERVNAERDGIPLSVEQLPQPLPPVIRNAAPLYDRWNTLRRSRGLVLPGYADALSVRYAYTPAQIALVQKMVDAHAELFTLLHQATGRPQCVFTIGSRDPITGLLDGSNSSLREAARELETESYLLAHAGRYPEAIQTQARGFRVAEHAAGPPTLTNYLVGNAIEAITLSGMRNILTLAGPNAAVDNQVYDTVAAQRSRLSLKKALSGEVAISLAEMDHFRTARPTDIVSLFTEPMSSAAPTVSRPDNYSLTERRFLNKLLDAAEAEDIRRMRPVIAAADQAPSARRAAFAPIPGGFQDPAAGSDPPLPLSPIEAFLSRTYPAVGDLDQYDSRRLALEQIVLAAAALLSARARAGAYPPSLPDAFTDPFNNKPLGYRREGLNGFVVYSVGPDGTFTGGHPGDEPTSQHILFRYPPPARKPVPPDMLK